MYACVRQLHGAYGAVRAEQPLAYPPSQRRALRFSKRTEHTVCRTVRVLRVLQCADADGVLPGEQLPSVRWRDRGEEQRGEGAQGRSRRGRARLREGVRASARGNCVLRRRARRQSTQSSCGESALSLSLSLCFHFHFHFTFTFTLYCI